METRWFRAGGIVFGIAVLAGGCGERPTGPRGDLPEISENGPVEVPGIEVTVEEDDPWTCEESPACMPLLDENAVSADRRAALRDSLFDNLPPLCPPERGGRRR